MADGAEYYAAKAVHAIDPALVKRARERAAWWREMHGPNDLDEEIYDELADALVALAAERKQFIEALRWIDEKYEDINLGHQHFRVGAKLKASAALEHLPSPSEAKRGDEQGGGE